jgi:dTMP kinase
MKGLFVSIDGLDGCGKSTQCRLLTAWLKERGMRVTSCADPGGTELGDVLRSILLDSRKQMTPITEALLFMASRAQLVAEVIRPALDAGQAIVSDRFLLSTIAYQGYAGGLDPAQVRAIGLLATDGLEPDLTFVLDLPIEKALTRRTGLADRVESRDGEFHARVRAGFRAEAENRPERILLLNAEEPVERVHERIRREVERRLRARPHLSG